MSLRVKKLHKDAIAPTVAHPGEDLGFDLYALEPTRLERGKVTKVRTGIAARFIDDEPYGDIFSEYGLIIKDRSSLAAKGITVSGGVIDAGYTNEILVLLTFNGIQFSSPESLESSYMIEGHSKIAQMIPIMVNTWNPIEIVDELPKSVRELNGFGSSGQ